MFLLRGTQEESESEEMEWCSFKTEEEATSHYRQPLEADRRKARKWILPSEPPEGTSPFTLHLDSSQLKLI